MLLVLFILRMFISTAASTEARSFILKDVLRKPFFTYETQKVSSLLAQMREKSVSFSIVLDEYGVTAGLITLEDIVEEIFGELRDEYDDSEEETFKKLSEWILYGIRFLKA